MEPNSPGGHGGGATGGGASSNITQIGGAAIALGQTDSAHSLPVTLANDQTLTVAGSVTATGSTTLLAGSAIAGKVGIDQTTDGTTNAVHLVAGTAVAGKFGIDQTTPGTTNAMQMIPGTAGGLSVTRTIIPNNTTNLIIKAGAGQLYAIGAYTNGSVIAYVKAYNAVSATAGSGTPVDTFLIPAPAAGGGGGIIWSVPSGVAYGTGITAIVTTGIADNDTTAPAASAYILTFYYK